MKTLTAALVVEIRRRSRSGTVTAAALAKEYGVSRCAKVRTLLERIRAVARREALPYVLGKQPEKRVTRRMKRSTARSSAVGLGLGRG